MTVNAVKDASVTGITERNPVTKEVVMDETMEASKDKKPKEENAIIIETELGEPVGDTSVSGPDWLNSIFCPRHQMGNEHKQLRPHKIIRTVAGHHSLPESDFANKTKMFFWAKHKRREITGPWNIGHCDLKLFWGQRSYYTDSFSEVWH